MKKNIIGTTKIHYRKNRRLNFSTFLEKKEKIKEKILYFNNVLLSFCIFTIITFFIFKMLKLFKKQLKSILRSFTFIAFGLRTFGVRFLLSSIIKIYSELT